MARLLFATFLMLAPFLGSPPAHAAIAPCDDGYRYFRSFRVDINEITEGLRQDVFCTPARDSMAVGTQGSAGVGIAAGGSGASAGAGALTAEAYTPVESRANADIALEFTLTKVDPTLPDLAVREVEFEAELLTLRANAEASGPASATIGGSGTVSLVTVDDMGRLIGQVNTKVTANLADGSSLPFVGSSFIRVDEPHAIQLSVSTLAKASASTGSMGHPGSAAAELSLALSAVLLAPEGYEIRFTTSDGPTLGAYPHIDTPLTLIPLPAPQILLASALALLPAVKFKGSRSRGRAFKGSYHLKRK